MIIKYEKMHRSFIWNIMGNEIKQIDFMCFIFQNVPKKCFYCLCTLALKVISVIQPENETQMKVKPPLFILVTTFQFPRRSKFKWFFRSRYNIRHP